MTAIISLAVRAWPASPRTLAAASRALHQDADLYVMINSSDRDETFQIQEGRPGEWRQIFDMGIGSGPGPGSPRTIQLH